MVKELTKTKVEGKSLVVIPGTNLTACKVDIVTFKNLVADNDNMNTYNNINLLTVYEEITNIRANCLINYFISSGFIFLVPDSGISINVDLENLLFAVNTL